VGNCFGFLLFRPLVFSYFGFLIALPRWSRYSRFLIRAGIMTLAKSLELAPIPADAQLIAEYLDAIWMEKGLSDNTQESYRRDLAQFAVWLNQQDGQLISVDAAVVQDYLDVRLQQKLSSRTSARFLSCVRGFYRYLLRENRISENPVALIDNPKLSRPLPKSLSEADVEALLAAPDLSDPIGLRDRTMLEVLYACGLRVTELVELTMPQVNLRQNVVRVMGKGSKERLIPMGEEAAAWLARPGNDPPDVLVSHKTLGDGRGHQKRVIATYIAACVCDTFIESRRRFTCGTVAARTQRPIDDTNLHPRGQAADETTACAASSARLVTTTNETLAH